MTSHSEDHAMIAEQSPSSLSVKRSLVKEREALCEKIHKQRALLAQQLGPVAEVHRDYPRSMIMRFFTQRPALAASMLGKAGALILGARFFKSSGAAVAVASLLQSVITKRR